MRSAARTASAAAVEAATPARADRRATHTRAARAFMFFRAEYDIMYLDILKKSSITMRKGNGLAKPRKSAQNALAKTQLGRCAAVKVRFRRFY